MVLNLKLFWIFRSLTPLDTFYEIKATFTYWPYVYEYVDREMCQTKWSLFPDWPCVCVFVFVSVCIDRYMTITNSYILSAVSLIMQLFCKFNPNFYKILKKLIKLYSIKGRKVFPIQPKPINWIILHTLIWHNNHNLPTCQVKK